MCQFVSHIEYKNKIWFLTNADLETKAGKELLKSDVKDDLCGHGAIQSFYPELKGKGVHKECEDFSSPDNFPKEISDAIKEGRLSRIGICLDVLNDKGKAKYEEVKASAFSEIVSQKKYRNKNWK